MQFEFREPMDTADWVISHALASAAFRQRLKIAQERLRDEGPTPELQEVMKEMTAEGEFISVISAITMPCPAR